MNERPLPWLSIIIPTLNEANQLPRLLHALRATPPDKQPTEIIVIDGGSHDATPAIAAEAGIRLLSAPRGRARQLNAGAREARGEFLWFVHADTLPPTDWKRHLKLAANSPYPASFSLRFGGQDESWWLRAYSAGSRYNLMAFRFGDQSLFVAASDFLAAGGFRESMQLMEGHELARRLKRQTGGFQLLPAAVTTSARRYQRYGHVYTQLVFVLIFTLHYCGLSQSKLKKLYLRAFP